MVNAQSLPPCFNLGLSVEGLKCHICTGPPPHHPICGPQRAPLVPPLKPPAIPKPVKPPLPNWNAHCEDTEEHTGRSGAIDVPDRDGRPVLAPEGGWVTGKVNVGGIISKTRADDPEGGNQLLIISDDGSRMYDFAHLRDAPLKVGKHVNAGDIIGHVDEGGKSTGSHLHFSYHTLNNNKAWTPQNPYSVLGRLGPCP